MPYSPQTSFTAPQLFAQAGMEGNRNAMQMGQWLSEFIDRQKQVSAAGKSADYFLKANPQAAAEMGIHPDEWNNLGARDKAAAVQGYIQSKSSQNQAAEMLARTKWLQEQGLALAQKRELEGNEAEAWPRLAAALAAGGGGAAPDSTTGEQAPTSGTPPPDISGSPIANNPFTPLPPVNPAMLTNGTGTGPTTTTGAAPPMPARMIQAIAQMGATNPRLASALARQVIPSLLQSGEGEPMSFTEDPVSGFRFATKGKIVQSSGVNPAKVSGIQLLPQHDEDGNLLGYSQVDARGHAVFHPAKGQTLKQAQDQDGNAIPGFYVDDSGKLHDTRSAIEKMTGQAPAAGGGGRVQVQDKNGKKFTVPAEQLPAALKQGYTQVK